MDPICQPSFPNLDSNLLRRLLAAGYRRVPPVRGYLRPLPKLNELLLGNHKSAVVTTRMQLGHKMIVDLHALTEYQTYYTGRYDDDRIKSLLPFVPKDSTILDIGANVGFYAIPFALHLSAHGVVHAFEPVKSNAKRLRENALINGVTEKLRVHEVALSDHCGHAEITLREDFERGSETGNAALAISDGADARFQAQDVLLAKLDDLSIETNGGSISLIKIDVEGHEDLALTGARNMLANYRPLIAAEINEDYFRRRNVDVDEGISSALDGLAYDFLGYGNFDGWRRINTLRGRRATDDVLLVPRERVESILHRLDE